MILKNIPKDKQELKKIKDGKFHKLFRNRYLAIKRVLDYMHKSIVPGIEYEQTLKIKKNEFRVNTQPFIDPVLDELSKLGIIKFKNEEYINTTTGGIDDRSITTKYITIRDQNFFENYINTIWEFYNSIQDDGVKRFPQEYESTVKEKQKISNIRQNNKNKQYTIILSLNNGGDGIFRKFKNEKLTYKIKENTKRVKIIKNLKSENKSGNFLTKKCDYYNLTQLSKEVGEINKLFKNNLQIKENLIINNHRNSGYELNRNNLDIIFR
jgi:hypothetical protein